MLTVVMQGSPLTNIRGVARPAPHLVAALRVLHAQGSSVPLTEVMDEVTLLERVAAGMRAIPPECVDPLERAAYVVRELTKYSKEST